MPGKKAELASLHFRGRDQVASRCLVLIGIGEV